MPPLSGRVVDQTGTLSASDATALTQRLKDLETRKGSQVAVLIVPTTQPRTIEQFSIRVAEAWKIGRKKIDDGALLVVAKNDHKLRIEVGYGLEGALTDVTARRIIDEIIVPRFKTGDFASAGFQTASTASSASSTVSRCPPQSRRCRTASIRTRSSISSLVRSDSLLTSSSPAYSAVFWAGCSAPASPRRGRRRDMVPSGIDRRAGILGVIAFFLTIFGDSILAAGQQAGARAWGLVGW